MSRWKKDGKDWLYGIYQVRRNPIDKQWDISSDTEGGYVCSTRYLHRAKWIVHQFYKAVEE